jgi:uncharacterized protein
MSSDLVIDVDDLVGHPEATREISGAHQVSLRLGDVTVDAPVAVTGELRGTIDGVIADFSATAPAHFVCVRCLTEWDGEVVAAGTRHLSNLPDEDGYAIVDRLIDLGGPVRDELALGLPSAPVCREECKGLCPICGTDLNEDPCDGHGEDSDSPFAALKDLFDS